jgi:hypothetical protein
MSRDEKIGRVEGVPPEVLLRGERSVIGPSEPAGGTWVTVNDGGAAFALINWYSVAVNNAENGISRGLVVKTVCHSTGGEFASKALKKLPLTWVNPFRLVGVFPAKKEIIEWRWNRKRLVQKRHRWQTQQWASSGFDEPTAQRFRGQIFKKALFQKNSGSLAWLRHLHRSHLPSRGPFSICMHRDGFETVSYTEIGVSTSCATMRYHSGIPCLNFPLQVLSLKIQ